MESSDGTCKLKNFTKRHDKNEERRVIVLQNVSFIQSMKFFLLLRIEKKNILICLHFTYQNRENESCKTPLKFLRKKFLHMFFPGSVSFVWEFFSTG